MIPSLVEKLAGNLRQVKEDHPHVFIGVIGAAIAAVVLRSATRSRKQASKDGSIPLPSPPGRLPLIGHFLSLYPSPHLQMDKWARELGPIYQISFGSREYVVLNNAEVVRDMLEVRGQYNSDRNPNHIINLMSADGSLFAWGDDNAYLRQCRRLLLGSVSKSAIEKKYPELHNKETFEFLQNMYKHGTQPQGCKALHYSYLYTINLTMDFMYGHHFDTFDDPAYRELHRMAGDFAEAVNYLLIEYPQSIYFMLGRLKKMAKHVQDEFQRILGGYNALMREAVANGREIDCLMYDMVQAQEKEGLTEIDLGNLAANILVAAVDTTAVSMQNLFLILVNRPDIQRKVQDELDRVVGDRMPTDQDLKDLPYVEAVTTELLRFRPPLFLNMAHSARERQVYRGYEIPEGVGIFHNIYSTNFEEAIYPNPEVFNPDRFYKPENPVQREHWTFGAGRRLCPGNQFAEKSLLLTTARVLWAFDLVHPRDANGDKIDVPMSEIVQPFPQPPDVNITFVPRHANLAEQLHLSS